MKLRDVGLSSTVVVNGICIEIFLRDVFKVGHDGHQHMYLVELANTGLIDSAYYRTESVSSSEGDTLCRNPTLTNDPPKKESRATACGKCKAGWMSAMPARLDCC